jgi:hypothetical protein
VAAQTQHELERQVAAATGESVATIRRRGFSIVDLAESKPEVIQAPQCYDWDQLDSRPLRLVA